MPSVKKKGLPKCYSDKGTVIGGRTIYDCKGYRLPTEAEWEYATRAGTQDVRYGSLGEIAWYSDNSGSRTHPVGQKQPNAFGLYDMLGNVWEWCHDSYVKYKHSLPNGVHVNPQTTKSAGVKVARGGSFSSVPVNIRAADRYYGGWLAGSVTLVFVLRGPRTSAQAPARGRSPLNSDSLTPFITAKR